MNVRVFGISDRATLQPLPGTILSAVFLPLTLISAVYGMNFNDLPGMGVPYGYLVVIALMFATAGFTAGYLYWRGWFE